MLTSKINETYLVYFLILGIFRMPNHRCALGSYDLRGSAARRRHRRRRPGGPPHPTARDGLDPGFLLGRRGPRQYGGPLVGGLLGQDRLSAR